MRKSVKAIVGLASPYVFAGLANLLLLPLLLRFSLSRRLRSRFAERLSWGCWTEAPGEGSPRIWFHAASVGEVGGITPLLKMCKDTFPDARIMVTTTSTTGLRRALEEVTVSSARLLPIDHPRAVKRALESFAPDLCVVTETELWPNFLFALKKKGIPAVLINARISDYTYPAYRRICWLIGPALRAFTSVLAQTKGDAERFISLGLPQDTVSVVGSTKYDRLVPAASEEKKRAYAAELGIDPEKPCFVAGSVRETEDRIVIEAFLRAKEQAPELQMIIAPRHPERFDAVSALLSARGVSFNRRSEGEVQALRDVILLDTLGELSQAYSLSWFSFVGASLVDIGGHNPLEPAAFASPVMMGPYSSNVRDAVRALEDEGGFFEVGNSSELTAALVSLARNSALRELSGRAAYRVWQSNLGAAERVFSHLTLLLGQKVEVGNLLTVNR